MVVEGIVGFLESLSIPFLDNWFTLSALLFLIPLTLVLIFLMYSIRSHPKNVTLPSLYFLVSRKEQASPKKFLRKLPFNIMLIIHLLLITTILAAAAQPFIMLPRSSHPGDVVLIVDASMSMQTADRFSQALGDAKSKVGEKNTIIGIYENPVVIAENVGAIEARTILQNLKTAGTKTGLHAALQQVIDMQKKDASIHIFSDGIPTVPSPTTIEYLKSKLESNRNSVFFHTYTQGTKNIAIIDATVTSNQTSVKIKNYNDHDQQITVRLAGQQVPLTLPAFEIATASFKTPKGKNTLQITADDDNKADNELFISSPEQKTYKIQYITNNPNPYLQLALSLLENYEVVYSTPPGEIVQASDMYIIDNVDPKLLLPGTIPEILERVEESQTGVLIVMNPQMTSIDWHDALPVEITPQVVNEQISLGSSKITQDVSLSGVQPVLKAIAHDKTTTLAFTPNSAAIVRKSYGAGSVYYFGLQQSSDFYFDFTFPILIKQMLDSSVENVAVEQLNINTGTLFGSDQTTTVLPDGSKIKGQFVVKNAGFYQNGKNIFAANTLDEQESHISQQVQELKGKRLADVSSTNNSSPYPITFILLWLALLLLALELFILKWRGEA